SSRRRHTRYKVTGVQTCALPISNFNVVVTPGNAYFRPEHYYQTSHYSNLSLDEWKKTVLEKTHRSEIMPLSPFVNNGVQTSVIRSEERRVGKEWRSRLWRYH